MGAWGRGRGPGGILKLLRLPLLRNPADSLHEQLREQIDATLSSVLRPTCPSPSTPVTPPLLRNPADSLHEQLREQINATLSSVLGQLLPSGPGDTAGGGGLSGGRPGLQAVAKGWKPRHPVLIIPGESAQGGARASYLWTAPICALSPSAFSLSCPPPSPSPLTSALFPPASLSPPPVLAARPQVL